MPRRWRCGAQIAIPIPGTPVPFTLQPLAVVLAGLCLGPVAGAASMVLYLLAGALGAPVFSPIGAPGVLAADRPDGRLSPCGAGCCGDAGLVVRRFPGIRRTDARGVPRDSDALLGGVAQLELLTGSLERAAAMGTVPFILADLGKVVVAAITLFDRSLRPRT